jgi:hypothetical protein
MIDSDSDAVTVVNISEKEYPRKSAPRYTKVVKWYFVNANCTTTTRQKMHLSTTSFHFFRRTEINKYSG